MAAAAEVAAVVQRLRSPSPSVQAAAALTAQRMVRGNPQLGAALAAAGCVDAVAACLRNGTLAVRHSAACLLATLAADSAAHGAALVAAGGAPVLVQLLHSDSQPTADVATIAAFALAARDDAAVCTALLHAGALQPLGQQLLRSDDEVLLVRAAAAVNNVSHSAAGGPAAAAAAGVLPGLVRCLGAARSPETRGVAAHALNALSRDGPKCCQPLAAAGAIPAVVQLLARLEDIDADKQLVLNCNGTLQHLTANSPERARAILAAGGAAALARFLSSRHWEVVDSCAATLILLHGSDRLLSAHFSSVSAGASVAANIIIKYQELARSPLGPAVQQAAAAAMRRLRSGAFRGQGAEADEVTDEAQRAAGATSAAAPAAPSATSQATAVRHPQPPRPPRVCGAPGCGATRGLRRCGGCGMVRYCSEACSRAHWREHRAECRRRQADRAPAAAPSGIDTRRT